MLLNVFLLPACYSFHPQYLAELDAGWRRRAWADGGTSDSWLWESLKPFSNLSAPVCEAPGQSPMHTHSRAHGLEFSPLIPLRPHLTSWAELTPPTSASPCPEPGVFARPHIPDPEAQSTGCTSKLWHPPAPQSLTDDL